VRIVTAIISNNLFTSKSRSKIHAGFITVIWPIQIPNQELWARAKQRPIELEIRQKKWGWLGHTLRRPPGDIAKAALEWNPQGTRSLGRSEQHGAEQSSKRLGIKAKHGKKSKYSPQTVSDGETL
jgi:hypothetical protein